MKIPSDLRSQLAQSMEQAGIPVPANSQRWEQAESALKGVWASKYNDRAYYSLRKVRAAAALASSHTQPHPPTSTRFHLLPLTSSSSHALPTCTVGVGHGALCGLLAG